MKFYLTLYICSMLSGQCVESFIPGYTFKNHYECVIAGYAVAQRTMKSLAEDNDYYGLEKINEERLAIKFECKQLSNA
jgi:hypothetical protein